MTSFEVVLDNSTLTANCFEEMPEMPEIHIDVPMTRANIIRNGPGTEFDLNEFLDSPFSIVEDMAKTPTYVYPIEYNGFDSTGTGFIPETPDGYTLQNLRPIMKAYLSTSDSQLPISDDTSDWGYHPAPTKAPFMVAGSFGYFMFEDFPVGSPPSDWIVCGATTGPSTMWFSAYFRISNAIDGILVPTITVTAFGWRFTYIPT